MKIHKMSIQDRLSLMISAGYPIFVIARRVSWPVEAEDFFKPEEMKELEGYILSSC